MIPVTAIVLAAGLSSRMGDFKPLLPIDGVPMLEAVLTKVLSFPFKEAIAVVGHKEQKIRETIEIQDDRFNWVVNKNFIEGLSSSIKAAIQRTNNDTFGIFIFLGDQPLIKKTTIEQMLKTIMEKEIHQTKCIVQPTFNGMPGHPVFISSQMIPYLKSLTGAEGAKPIFAYAEKHIYLPIDDEGIILDVDTKQDYKKVLAIPKSIRK